MLTLLPIAAVLASLIPTAQSPRVETVEALGLTLTIPVTLTDFAELPGGKSDDSDLASWSVKLGGKSLRIDVSRTEDKLDVEPSQITWRVHDYVRDDDYEGPSFDFEEHRLLSGEFGYVPYASLLHGSISERGETKASGHAWYLAGVSEQSAWVVYIGMEPAPSAAEKKVVLDFLSNGIRYAGKKRDAKWTEDELSARWKADSPVTEKKKGKLEVIRTAHYAVMTNSSGGKRFAEQMEINYGIIQKTYPFAEIRDRKLMPVFLFQMPEEYYEFCVAQFKWSLEEARKSKGVASRDFYATWYEAPGDPVHIHEATHQIFENRLELGGAGSWFQEGVAEYIETKPNERNDIARIVKSGKHTPLREFMRLRSLLMSSEDDLSGDSAAAHHYKQAALLIEFLRDSKFGKEKFLDWMHAIGNVRYNHIPSIEDVFKRIYGLNLDELDLKLQEYCKKR